MTPLSVPRPWNENSDMVGAATECYVATIGHLGRVAGQHRVDAERDVRGQRRRGRQDAAQVVFLLHRPDQVQRRAGLADARLGQREQRGTSGAVVDGGTGDPAAGQLEDPRQVGHRRTDADAAASASSLEAKPASTASLAYGTTWYFSSGVVA